MYQNQMPGRRSGLGMFLLFLVVGVYFLNSSLNFFPIPAALASNAIYNQILFFIAGVLMLLGGFKFLFPKRY